MNEKYIKDFKNWFPVKEAIDIKRLRTKFFEREIWWCNLGVNIGFEQDGKGVDFVRPVLVYKKHNSIVLTIIPLSTKIKEDNQFYQKFTFQGREQSAIVSQVRTIDSKRLINKMGDLSNKQFNIIKERFVKMFC